MKKLILICAFAFASMRVCAHPVSYKGATSLMTWNQPFLTDTMLTYSFRRNAAVAGEYMRMDMEDRSQMKYYGPQLNWLVRRWNGTDHQANIYVSGGGGGFELDNRKRSAGFGSVEADYETRKVYFSAKSSAIAPSIGSNITHSIARAGVSTHEADFDDVSNWLILEVQHNTQLEHTVTVTPILRTFYKNILTEVGASFEGDWMLNFMVHL